MQLPNAFIEGMLKETKIILYSKSWRRTAGLDPLEAAGGLVKEHDAIGRGGPGSFPAAAAGCTHRLEGCSLVLTNDGCKSSHELIRDACSNL